LSTMALLPLSIPAMKMQQCITAISSLSQAWNLPFSKDAATAVVSGMYCRQNPPILCTITLPAKYTICNQRNTIVWQYYMAI
jgi:hypothetical protein